MSCTAGSAGARFLSFVPATINKKTLKRGFLTLFSGLILQTSVFAESPFSVTGEVAVYGPYGIGAGIGTFYEKPDLIPFVSGFWGSAALLFSDEEGVFEDYTETLIDLQVGGNLDTSQIPLLRNVEKLDVFAGLTLGRRSYTYLNEDYSKILFGVVAGGLYSINETWAVGGKLSTMTRDPRLLVRYSF
ncbi:hypothetical protein [Reinekea blandensis]|uniref:Uncharacterized protein n=1 Tax=Reinekea blandensis MED297 TaxID=314283 RepID=A4BAW4_9GAMM|nr:hypothetical protein [Reinekea blandensis]EAR10577.1 hypothetical protein MED297_11195 [Reinekea sp. MED297] [Reinekea blandensis MED297]